MGPSPSNRHAPVRDRGRHLYRREVDSLKILRALALALAISLLAAACGGGDEDTGGGDAGGATETEAAAPSNDEFCESVVAAEAAVLAASSGGDPAPVEDLVATAEETAPEELSEPLAVVVAGVRKALETRDDSAFQTEEFTQSEEEIDVWVAGNCGYESVEVSAVDYAFEGVPETLPAGTTTFTFTNNGKEVHEMLVVRYKDPSTTIEDLMKLSDKDAQKKIDFLGASFGPPGTVDTEPRELTAGKYALLCFIPVGSTDLKAARKADGPPHVARGMSAEFTVE